MATSQFTPFGLGGGAYVLTPAAWAADAVRSSGFPPGKLLKERLNTPLRQASSVATMIANFIAANQADNVLDDGDLVTLQSQFEDALGSFASGSGFEVDISGTSGILRLPASLGGIILKWGNTPVVGADSSLNFNFPAVGDQPAAFPNAIFGVLITSQTNNGVGGAENYSWGAALPQLSGFRINNDASASYFFYLAIGR